MQKKLWIPAVLLVAVVGFLAGRSVGSADSLPATPQIIRRVALTNQTAPIPQTVLFTPSHNGVYRLHGYMAVTFQVGNYWTPKVNWTDDRGAQSNAFISPMYEVLIEAVAGTPVTYSVDVQGSPGPYSLYITVERLAP